MSRVYPELFANLPRTDVGVDGVDARLVQGPAQQVVFMEFDHDVEVPEHSHAAQWGIVVAGEMTLSIEGVPRTLRKGDSYFLPAGVKHSAQIKKGYADVTMFDQVDRYAVAPDR